MTGTFEVITRVKEMAILLPKIVSTTYTAGNVIKTQGSVINRNRVIAEEHKHFLTDNLLRERIEGYLSRYKRNCHHIDGCFPPTSQENLRMRRMLKSYLFYESSGAVKAPNNDMGHSEGRAKFAHFMSNANGGIEGRNPSRKIRLNDIK